MIIIYHNPRCGKSRECLAFLENSNQELKVIKYLETPLKFEELKEIIHKLNCKPITLIRIKEAIWIEKYKGKSLSDEQIIQAMVDYPILMERPIAINGNKAVIAKPFEKITEII